MQQCPVCGAKGKPPVRRMSVRAKKASSARSRRPQKPRRAKRLAHRKRTARAQHAAAVNVSVPVSAIESVPTSMPQQPMPLPQPPQSQLQPLPAPQPQLQPIYATVTLPMAVTEPPHRPAIETAPMATVAAAKTMKYRRVVPWVAVGVTVAAIMIAARQQTSQEADVVETVAVEAPANQFQDVGPQPPEISPSTETVEVPVEPKKAVATKAPAVASPKTLAADVAALPQEPVNVRAADTAARTTEVAPPPAAEVATKVEEPAVVTITGCLALDQETIRLKDTSGAEAPKSRSWRSGFLKKRSAAVELVDASHSLALTTYAGQRVSATGTLMERTMQVRSVHRVTASCN